MGMDVPDSRHSATGTCLRTTFFCTINKKFKVVSRVFVLQIHKTQVAFTRAGSPGGVSWWRMVGNHPTSRVC
jgi:hypothetical protein